MGARYRFRARWVFDAPIDAVFECLYRLKDYPLWWPQFTHVTQHDEDEFDMTVRSFLPYDVKYRLRTTVADRDSGRLVAEVSGDIIGRISWQLTTNKNGRCVVQFSQQVSTSEWYMNLFAPLARVLFEWNHRRMMDRGRVAMRAFLSGYKLAKEEPGVYAAL